MSHDVARMHIKLVQHGSVASASALLCLLFVMLNRARARVLKDCVMCMCTMLGAIVCLLDDVLQRFFLVAFIYGVFLPLNHIQHCSFSLLCLWNPQIQFNISLNMF